MRSRTFAALLATALTTLALPAAAHARGTLTYDGTTMTFSGDAAADQVGVGVSQGELSWVTSGLDAVPAACRTDEYLDYLAYCPFPQRIVVDLGGGNDGFSISSKAWDPFPAGIAVTALGGDGDDRIQSAHVQDGGPGNDRLEGHDGDQTLHGGRGNDVVDGGAGNDQLNGDMFKAPGTDVIDGGPGDDYLEGGWNNDTLVGGPGRDTVFADDTGASCNYWTWCRVPFGNDTVDVRDGEVDTVDCGIGTDTVKADPVDVLSNCETVDTGAAVAPRPAGPGGRGGTAPGGRGRTDERRLEGGRGGGGKSGGRGGSFALRVAEARLGTALRDGLGVRFAAPGAGQATVTVKRGRSTVAVGSARVRRAGAVSVRAVFSRAGKRALRSADRAALRVKVRFVPRSGRTAQTSAKTVTLARR